MSAAITNLEKLRAKEVIETSTKSGFLRIIFTSWITERFMRGRHRKTSRKSKPLPIPAGTAPKVYTPIETEYNSVVTAYREKYLTGKYRLVLESVESGDIRKAHAA